MKRYNSNMNPSEIVRSYCVKVNGGSGVLINAMTEEYSYVLTAAHVIENVNDYEVLDCEGNSIQVLAVLLYPKEHIDTKAPYDCAILKVAYQERVYQKIFPATSLPNQANLTLVGYPQTERESDDPIKFYDGHFTNIFEERLIFTVNGVPPKATIDGMSGGGVYHVKGNIPFLVGVEFQMDGTGTEQQYGRVQCHSLARFKEIIAKTSNAPMIPAYMECFSRVRDNIFEFNVYKEQNVADLKVALLSFADELISKGITPPHKIMEQYDSQLLVDPINTRILENKELWIAFLEFLVISALLDNVPATDEVYIKNTERKRRLLYSDDGTNWMRRLEEILKIARRLLDKDGTLIIASPETAADVLPTEFRLKDVISNISVVPNQGPLDSIDNVEASIYSSYRVAHLEGLRKRCVVDNEDEYKTKPYGKAQLQLFREKLDEIIK